jgi:hypothetical protein
MSVGEPEVFEEVSREGNPEASLPKPALSMGNCATSLLFVSYDGADNSGAVTAIFPIFVGPFC